MRSLKCILAILYLIHFLIFTDVHAEEENEDMGRSKMVKQALEAVDNVFIMKMAEEESSNSMLISLAKPWAKFFAAMYPAEALFEEQVFYPMRIRRDLIGVRADTYKLNEPYYICFVTFSYPLAFSPMHGKKIPTMEVSEGGYLHIMHDITPLDRLCVLRQYEKKPQVQARMLIKQSAKRLKDSTEGSILFAATFVLRADGPSGSFTWKNVTSVFSFVAEGKKSDITEKGKEITRIKNENKGVSENKGRKRKGDSHQIQGY